MAVVLGASLLGAAIAARTRQSMILGYLGVGVALGYLATQYLEPEFGIQIRGNESVSILADLGVAFLLFFVGLEVSVSRLKAAGRPATVLALADVAVLYFTGTLLGFAMGWPLVDTLFLAGILAMSSVGIAAKSLTELKRLANDETATLLGMMIIEDFITMIILAFTVAWALGAASPTAVTDSLQAVVLVYGVLIVAALLVIPRFVRKIERVRNDEVFALLALGLIFGSAALAETYGMPFIIGTFFVGMAFSESRLSERLTLRLSTLRDAFVGVFFLMFGVEIQLGAALSSMWIVAAAVIVVLVDELFILGALSFVMGFKGRAAAMIGASAVGRGEDSIIFADIGAGLVHPAGTAAAGAPVLSRHLDLYPVAGGVALVTSALVPLALRRTAGLARAGGRLVPHSVRHGTTAVGDFLHEAHLQRRPEGAKRKPAWLVWGAFAYVGLILGTLLTAGDLHMGLAAAGATLTLALGYGIFADAVEHLPATRVGRRHAGRDAHRTLAGHVAFTVASLLFAVDLVAAFFLWEPFATLLVAGAAAALLPASWHRASKRLGAVHPREEAKRLVGRARVAQHARVRRKYAAAGAEAMSEERIVGLRSVRELTFDGPPSARPGQEAPADGAGARESG
ncbi:MAG TPA: cation:proton antiporter [Candidatus Thermoplasmatota archaeon]